MAKIRKEYEQQGDSLVLKGSMPVFDANNDINLLNNLNIPGAIVKTNGNNVYAQNIQNISGTIALTSDIPSTYSDFTDVASKNHTHSEYLTSSALNGYATEIYVGSAISALTYSSVGALSAATHIPSDPVNADWSATSGLSSIKNKPTLGTAASMASTAFRPASWMPTYSDVGALSSATVIPSTYSDVGAASASHTHTDYVEREGDTMIGQLVAQNNIAYTTAQVRNVILSTSEPTSTDGGNGDIWIVYKE